MGDDRPIRYLDPDGTVVYRASGLGACDGVILGLGAGRVPRDPPEWLLEVYNEGHTAEPLILAELCALEPWDRLQLDSQYEVELEIGEINDRRVIVRAHTDGWDADAEVLVEAKKFRPSTWDKFVSQKVECNPLYPWQVSSMMWGLAQTGAMPRLLFVGGAWNPDTNDIDEIGVYEYPDPPIPLKAIRKRIARWENLIASGMDVTDLTDKCSPSMFPCPMFGKGCPSEAAVEEIVGLTGDLAMAAEELAKQIDVQAGIAKTARTMGEAADKKRKELYEGLRAIHQALVDDGQPVPKKMRAGEYVITHVTGSVPEKVTRGYDLDYFTIKKEES